MTMDVATAAPPRRDVSLSPLSDLVEHTTRDDDHEHDPRWPLQMAIEQNNSATGHEGWQEPTAEQRHHNRQENPDDRSIIEHSICRRGRSRLASLP